MTGQQLLSDIYRAYRGKPDSRTPAWGAEKADLAISIANRKIIEWATDPRNKWASLFETSAPEEVGTVATVGTTALTGTGTYFTEYNVGDTIVVSGETVRTIATIVSDTSLTVTPAFSNTASSLTFTRSTIIDNLTLDYNLNRNFFQPSDYARIIKTDDSIVEYQIIKVQQRGLLDQSLYVHGLNPKKVTFAQTMDTGLDGAELLIPGYYMPAEISSSTDLVPVDDPKWLVYITASELARNDAAKDDQYPALVGMANDLYRKMSDANNDVGFLQLNRVVNNMPQVGDETESWV
jgi:hypothetical protein